MYLFVGVQLPVVHRPTMHKTVEREETALDQSAEDGALATQLVSFPLCDAILLRRLRRRVQPAMATVTATVTAYHYGEVCYNSHAPKQLRKWRGRRSVGDRWEIGR